MRRFLALALLLALPSAAWADIKTGVDAWESGDYAAAVAAWQQPAADGDADAQFNMGQAYKLGRGVPADLAIATQWYRKAAAQGHVQAESNLAVVLFQMGQRDEAIPILKKAAARGDARAQYVLATALFNGDHVDRDWVKAYALMTRAIEAGIPQAAASRAQMDEFVDPVQRAEGVALAGRLAIEPQLLLAEPAPVASVAALPAASPVAMPIATPAVAQVPVTTPIPAPTPPPPPVTVVAVSPSPKPPKVAAPPPAAAPVPSTGAWRVQLGAFSSEAKAQSLWSSLAATLPDLGKRTPVYARAGAIVRLQAAGFSTRNEADSFCRSVARTGNACFIVKG